MSSEMRALEERIEVLEERIQGLIGYLGVQAHRQNWSTMDLGPEEESKVISKNAQTFKHRPHRLGNKLLAHWAGMTILSIQGVQHSLSEKPAES